MKKFLFLVRGLRTLGQKTVFLKTFEIYFFRVFNCQKEQFSRNFAKNIKKKING